MTAKTDNQDGKQQYLMRDFKCEKDDTAKKEDDELSGVKNCVPDGRENYDTGVGLTTEVVRGPATSAVNNGLFGWFLSGLRPAQTNINQSVGGASVDTGDVTAQSLGGIGLGGSSSAGAFAGASASSSSTAFGVGVGGAGGQGGTGGSGGRGGAGGSGGVGGGNNRGRTNRSGGEDNTNPGEGGNDNGFNNPSRGNR